MSRKDATPAQPPKSQQLQASIAEFMSRYDKPGVGSAEILSSLDDVRSKLSELNSEERVLFCRSLFVVMNTKLTDAAATDRFAQGLFWYLSLIHEPAVPKLGEELHKVFAGRNPPVALPSIATVNEAAPATESQPPQSGMRLEPMPSVVKEPSKEELENRANAQKAQEHIYVERVCRIKTDMALIAGVSVDSAVKTAFKALAITIDDRLIGVAWTMRQKEVEAENVPLSILPSRRKERIKNIEHLKEEAKLLAAQQEETRKRVRELEADFQDAVSHLVRASIRNNPEVFTHPAAVAALAVRFSAFADHLVLQEEYAKARQELYYDAMQKKKVFNHVQNELRKHERPDKDDGVDLDKEDLPHDPDTDPKPWLHNTGLEFDNKG